MTKTKRKSPKILLVDDDRILAEMYRERLEIAGYNVEVSHNGESGLAKINHLKPDIIILDLMMPKLSGYEVLSTIKSDPDLKDTPVIVFSALMRDASRDKAMEIGANNYLIKSEVLPRQLIKKVDAISEKIKD